MSHLNNITLIKINVYSFKTITTLRICICHSKMHKHGSSSIMLWACFFSQQGKEEDDHLMGKLMKNQRFFVLLDNVPERTASGFFYLVHRLT